ncbi:hypothetical protein Pelo_7137 [Pelomyxa schiedti]|nr:hypothetical protein Pelo_7137 [Pelomyxa schiedti]
MKAVVLFVLFAGVAYGFMEDLCMRVPPYTTTGAPGLYNLYQPAFDIGCKPGNTSVACLKAVSQAAMFPPVCCIGSIHLLSTYMMAQALGMKSEYAYQLGVYTSASDLPEFFGCDACGNRLDDKLNAPPMLGMRRLNMSTGGYISHLPLTYDGHYGNGLNPDVHDHVNEGFVASYRDWAYSDPHHDHHRASDDHREDHHDHDGHKHHQEHHEGCLMGFTIPWINENLFTGPVCRSSEGYINSTLTMFLTGTRTVSRAEMAYIFINTPALVSTVKTVVDVVNHFGPMPLQDTYTLNDIQEWLRAYPQYSVLSNGKHVPEEIIRYGIYSHILGDRVSHYYCTDSKGTNMVRIKDSPPVYNAKYDPQMCNTGIHTLQHYWEIGHTPNVAQTASALPVLWQEMSDWVSEMKNQHSEWFKHKHTVKVDPIAAMADVVKVADAGSRMSLYLSKLQSFGFDTLPGFPNYSTVCVPKTTTTDPKAHH